jgi:hypothetical protein
MKEVKEKIEKLAKTNRAADAAQVQEALRLCEELESAGIVSERGVGYRISMPFSTPRSGRRVCRKVR